MALADDGLRLLEVPVDFAPVEDGEPNLDLVPVDPEVPLDDGDPNFGLLPGAEEELDLLGELNFGLLAGGLDLLRLGELNFGLLLLRLLLRLGELLGGLAATSAPRLPTNNRHTRAVRILHRFMTDSLHVRGAPLIL